MARLRVGSNASGSGSGSSGAKCPSWLTIQRSFFCFSFFSFFFLAFSRGGSGSLPLGLRIHRPGSLRWAATLETGGSAGGASAGVSA